jgi:hypothetical protein
MIKAARFAYAQPLDGGFWDEFRAAVNKGAEELALKEFCQDLGRGRPKNN